MLEILMQRMFKIDEGKSASEASAEKLFCKPSREKTASTFSPGCNENPFLRRLRRRKKDCNGKRDCLLKEADPVLLLKILMLHFSRIVVIHHPVDAEFICPHSEISAPKCFCKWHCHRSAFGKSVEKSVCFFFGICIYGN